jgi:Spy/CpxP family protein refolding chaperone
MIKKIAAALVATSMISTAVMAQGAGAGGPGMGMGKGMQKKGMKGMRSIFLIRGGLPHYSRVIKRMWNDSKLALTDDQKKKLEEIRKETMKSLMDLKPQIMKLRKEIVKASRAGKSAESQAGNVKKLASLKMEATMIHLKCIEKTRGVLKPEQMSIVDQRIKEARSRHM